MALLSGLRLDSGIISFDFQPSIGILARDVNKLGFDIADFKEPLQKSIKEVMIPSFEKNFAAEGRPSWVPMSEATKAIRQGRIGGGGGGGSKLLNRTGALRAVVTQESLWSVTDTFAAVRELPASVWYGNVQQAGYGGMARQVKAQMKKGVSAQAAAKAALKALDKKILSGAAASGGAAVNIPARPFVMFQDEDEDAIMEVFDKWLGEIMLASGFTGTGL